MFLTPAGVSRGQPSHRGKAGLRWKAPLTDGVPFAVPVQHVQRRDQELVGVLLLVACEVTRVSPHQVQQPEGNVWRTVARVELGSKEGRMAC